MKTIRTSFLFALAVPALFLGLTSSVLAQQSENQPEKILVNKTYFVGADEGGNIPDPDEFVPVEKEPAFEMSELRSLVKYPEEARRNDIEGTVMIKIYINALGRGAAIQAD